METLEKYLPLWVASGVLGFILGAAAHALANHYGW